MNELTQEGQNSIQDMFHQQQLAVGEMAKEIAEREFEMFEFNLFVSASGKKHLDKVSKAVNELRDMERKGKINLDQYTKISEEFKV